MCMRVLCLHICLCPTCVPAAHGPEKGVGRPDTVVTGSCELLCVCWNLNPGLLKEQLNYLQPNISLF